MSKAEKFIKDYTKNCSNVIQGYDDMQTPVIDYHPWLTPNQALRAVKIAREEIKSEIERLIKSYSPIWSSEGKYRVEAYKELLDFINSNCLEISRSENSHIEENGDLEKAAAGYAREQLANPDYPTYNDEYEIMCAFEAGAEWAYSHVLKPADGDDLPEIDREVIVLTQPYPLEENEYAVYFAHRPNPNGWDGKSVTTGEIEHYIPKTYDKGGWNQPNVKWWLDLELPKMEGDEV